MPAFYPEKVNRLWLAADHAGESGASDCSGTAVSFECGVRVKMFVSIDRDGGISKVRFVSNGCGWAVAAAEALAVAVEGGALQELHGLEEASNRVSRMLGEVPDGRSICVDLAVAALGNALAAYRKSRAAEWQGDTALICSCFGVSEDAIEQVSSSGVADTVESVGEVTGAGTGCGSCQMLIREILETAQSSYE